MRMSIAAGLVLVTLAGPVAAPAAPAKKPIKFNKGVVTRNSEEPGRVPYQQTVYLTSGDSRCSDFGCDVLFPAVPAGKRLVVQYVSLTMVLKPGFTPIASLRLGDFAETSIRIELVPSVSTLGGGSQYVRFSQPVFGFIDAGQQPYLQTGAGGAGLDTSFGAGWFVSGYLVDVAP